MSYRVFSIFLEKFSNCYILESTGLNNQVVLMLNSNIGSSICLYQLGIIIFTYSKRFYCIVSEQLPSCYLTCWSNSIWVEVFRINNWTTNHYWCIYCTGVCWLKSLGIGGELLLQSDFLKAIQIYV